MTINIFFACQSIFPQKVSSPTVSCSGYIKNEDIKMYSTFGETISGLKKNNKLIVIEGFYSSFGFFTNINEIKNEIQHFSIYPNPSIKKFYIENKSEINVKINIFNYSGTKIIDAFLNSKKIITIDNLNTGTYLINITSLDGQKIVTLKQIII